MEKVRYAEMLPHEILKRRSQFPAAFVGLGTLEWHGEHLAVGNDALKAEKLCELAAVRSGGFAFPTLWYGEPRTFQLLEADHDPDGRVKGFMGFDASKWTADAFGANAEEQVRFYQAMIYHLLVQLRALEMKAICLLCGHYPLYNFAQPAVERFNSSFTGVRAFAGIEFHYPDKGPEVGGDHAARWETSYLWYLRPDCVDMSIFLGRSSESLIGVVGEDPRTTATIEGGRRGAELIVEGMVRKARELLDARM